MSARTFVSAFAMAGFVFVGSAEAQTVQTNNGSPKQDAAIATYNAYFDDLTGMVVTWTYADGRTGSGVWGSLGGGLYGVKDADPTRTDNFELSGVGSVDTYGLFDPFVWSLTGADLAGFTIDATTVAYAVGPTTLSAVFDILNAPDIGTPNSSYGRPFDYGGCIFLLCGETSDSWKTLATYSEPVGIGGNNPVGDLYGVLGVSFGKTFKGDVDFSADVDLVDSPPPANVSPEPGSVALLATGLLGMAGAVRRRRK